MERGNAAPLDRFAGHSPTPRRPCLQRLADSYAICQRLGMCNKVARRIALGIVREDFSQFKITLKFSEGLPNLAATASIRITDTSPIIRATTAEGGLEADMVQRRWSWPVDPAR